MIKLLGILLIHLVLLASLMLADEKEIILPQIRTQKTVSLEEALDRVKTCRLFSDQPLTLKEVSAVLWAAGGNRYDAETGASRTYPSAGSFYMLAFYVVVGSVEGIEPGIYKYNWMKHTLTLIKLGDQRKDIVTDGRYAGFGAPPMIIVMAVDFKRAPFGERGRVLYVPIDAGHASQNLRLVAAAWELGAGIAGEFDAKVVKDLLGCKEDPILLIPLGHSF